MATIWRTENFGRGLHTKPARTEGGELYAADIENLQVDNEGFLRLRAGFEKVGPGGEVITGLASTASFLFVLRANGKLYVRLLDSLDTETEIEGVEDLEGRISVVSPFRTYAVLTSEGTDQGYWIDLREGEGLTAYPLGIDKPAPGHLEISKYPSDTLVENTCDDDVRLLGPDIFVAYAISYVRQFEAVEGERDTEALFNGMESELSEPVGFIFKRLDFRNDNHGPSTASTYQMANFDFSTLYTERTILPLSLGRAYKTSGGTENTTNLREASPGGVRIGYLEIEEGELVTALTYLEDGEKIVCRSASGSDVVITLSGDDAVVDNPATPDAGGFLSIMSANYTKTGTFVADTVYNVYPANADGTIKDAQVRYDSNLPDSVTGVNVYRSLVFNSRGHAASFDRITDLFENNPSQLDLLELVYRKIAYIPQGNLHLPFVDGVFAVKGDNEDQAVSTGDKVDDITGYRPYYHTIEFEDDNFTGVIAVFPPKIGIKNYPWSDQPEAVRFKNMRLPPEVKQIHYHQGRIYGPAGDRLVYSDYRGTAQAFWAYPPVNEWRRPDGGRIDFCASHREVLLIGASNGLFRLEGQDKFDFELDQISGAGPLDGYSWGALENTLGFIGSKGLYVTDAATVELVGDESLDGFFNAKTVVHGSVAFFVDNTILFFVGLQTIGETEITDNLFLFDDRYWVRWSGETITQFASIEEQIYVAGGAVFRKVQLDEGENTDADLPWAWESNLIHGQEQGVGNITKRFTELLVSAAGGTRITLKTWVDMQQNPTQQEITTRDDLYFQRIPIERIGKRLRFRLEGKGPVEIRGLQIEGEVS